MSIIVFSVLIFFISIVAGVFGALTGLGGGVIVITALVFLFHINIHYAMGASVISVMATSSGSSVAFLREGFTNLRIGMLLETTAVVGATLGALLVAFLSTTFIGYAFSALLFFSAYLTLKRREETEHYTTSHPLAIALQLPGTYPEAQKQHSYHVQRVPAGLIIMFFSGVIAGLLGIGAGTLKVLAMDQALRLPYKVATTTSNFMIGITAAITATVYLGQGYIDPFLAAPVMLGVLIGSFAAARLLPRLHTRKLRLIFSIFIVLLGVQMIYKTVTGSL